MAKNYHQDNETSDELATVFAAIPSTITSLNLSHNGLYRKSGAELATVFAAIPNSITALNLTWNNLGNKPSDKLTVAFAALPRTIKLLDLNNCGFSLKNNNDLQRLTQIIVTMPQPLFTLKIDNTEISSLELPFLLYHGLLNNPEANHEHIINLWISDINSILANYLNDSQSRLDQHAVDALLKTVTVLVNWLAYEYFADYFKLLIENSPLMNAGQFFTAYEITITRDLSSSLKLQLLNAFMHRFEEISHEYLGVLMASLISIEKAYYPSVANTIQKVEWTAQDLRKKLASVNHLQSPGLFGDGKTQGQLARVTARDSENDSDAKKQGFRLDLV